MCADTHRHTRTHRNRHTHTQVKASLEDYVDECRYRGEKGRPLAKKKVRKETLGLSLELSPV